MKRETATSVAVFLFFATRLTGSDGMVMMAVLV
jgi:hypothetical protein